tara:strand:- start:3510 stop:3899 length:390 start_codon:yes stop_codon:yes gene_type:complete
MSLSTRTYKDLAFSMFANPMSGDIGKSTGATAVKRAIVGILKTNFNERVFQPEFGSNIRALLFEQMNPITEQRMKIAVEEAVRRHEPRAQIIGVVVEGQEEQNRYLVKVLFNLSSESEPQELETYFERV